MAQAPMGAPQGIRLSQLLALLQQGQQQPPPQQGAGAPPVPMDVLKSKQFWDKTGSGSPDLNAMMPAPQQAAPPPPQQPSQNIPSNMLDLFNPAGSARMLMPQDPPVPPGITSPRNAPGRVQRSVSEEVLRKTPKEIFSGIGNPVNALPEDFFPSLHTDKKATPAAPSPQAAPVGPEQGSLFERLDAERGGTAQDKALAGMQGQGPTAQMFTSAAQEVMSKGADTPDKADELLRMEFQGDPEIEDALAQAKMRYASARQRSGEGPGVLEYIGYALSTLAGANPMQAAEAISRRGEKREDERLALQDLMGAQQMKVRNNQMNSQRADQMGADYQKMYAQQAKEQQRLSERGEDRGFERLKAGRGAALQRMNQLQQAANYSTNPAEKKALQAEIEQLKRRTQFFGRQLGEPEVDEQGKPIGQASPDAMRLLGLG